jgi:flagellar motility protein MotE (MotC chaperone)
MTRFRPTHSHVLLTLGVLFTAGGAARFLPDDMAFAETTPAEPAAPVEPAVAPEKIAARMPAPAEICLTGTAADLFQQDRDLFETEQQALTEQTLILQQREADLAAHLAELTALQNTLEARWAEMQATAAADIKHLAQMYSAMKPDQAAAIFNQMDPVFAAGFLRVMPSEQAGQILAGMDAKKAYVLSLKLAAQNADVRVPPT